MEQYEEACLVRELECQKMLILHFDVYEILFCPILFHFSPVRDNTDPVLKYM